MIEYAKTEEPMWRRLPERDDYTIGMRVRRPLKGYDGPPNGNGAEGTVCHWHAESSVGVHFDKPFRSGHDCEGHCPYNHGWYVGYSDLEALVGGSLEEVAQDA